MEKKNKAWWKRKETWGAALTVISGGLELFAPSHTVAYKVGVFLGLGLSATGLRKGYSSDNLPSGIASLMDKIPNSITGEKGKK